MNGNDRQEKAEPTTTGANRTGILFALRDDLDLVQQAESFGYESVWTAEGQGRTAFGKLERWATATEQIGLATGIANVFSRTPATLALAAATLDAHSGGRAILGLGVAHPGVVEEFHGAEFDRPLARLREYIQLFRRYLRGEASEFDGEFYTPRRTSFWEAFTPVREEIPVYNAALGEGNVTLTGEYADGWLPNLYPPSRFKTALEWLDRGTERTGRESTDVDVAMYILASVDENPDAARRAAADHVAYYLRDIPGYYARVAKEAGFGETVKTVQAADSREEAVNRLNDKFLNHVAVYGTADEARERVMQLRQMGVDLPIVRAPAHADRDAVERMLETFAPQLSK